MKNSHSLALSVLLLFLAFSTLNCQKEVRQENESQAQTAGPDEINLDNSVSSSSNARKKKPVALAKPDHIIFVWMENKGYSQIIGSSSAPYINSLRSIGTLFTNSWALTNPSYPNYIRFFSGATQGVSTNDCISGTPFSTPNLYSVLKDAGKSFAWYSEDLPKVGSTDCSNGYYREKHNPTTIFSNVSTTANKPFSYFPTDYTQLEQVVCITPNLMNDMHDGSISQGDTWIKNNLSSLVEWCRTHNSIFVVYWDEGNSTYGNQIPVIAVGQHVKANYKLGTKYDHYDWTKTISAMFNARTDWTSNVSTGDVITGCWQ